MGFSGAEIDYLCTSTRKSFVNVSIVIFIFRLTHDQLRRIRLMLIEMSWFYQSFSLSTFVECLFDSLKLLRWRNESVCFFLFLRKLWRKLMNASKTFEIKRSIGIWNVTSAAYSSRKCSILDSSSVSDLLIRGHHLSRVISKFCGRIRSQIRLLVYRIQNPWARQKERFFSVCTLETYASLALEPLYVVECPCRVYVTVTCPACHASCSTRVFSGGVVLN